MNVMRVIPSVLGLAGAAVLVAMAAGAAQAEGPKTSTVLGGKGAPQSEFCRSVGGTESGSFCTLESGDSCESMTLARGEGCKGPDGEMIPLEEDFGSNMAPEDEVTETDETEETEEAATEEGTGDEEAVPEDEGMDMGDTVEAEDSGDGGSNSDAGDSGGDSGESSSE